MTTTNWAETAAAAIGRLSGLSANRVRVEQVAHEESRFAVETDGTTLVVTASDPVSAVSGYAAYARRTGTGIVSRFGTRPIADGPLPPKRLEAVSPYRWRIAYNITVAGYTTPFFDWAAWERELDLLAASGVNAAHLTLGQELVWLKAFQKFGYSEQELLEWIVPPSHQPWQWLNNIEYFGGGTSRGLIERRAELARQVIGRMRELGITPIFPGFSGTVPKGFAERNPGAHVVPQGKWFFDITGAMRPDWLATDSALYAEVAAAFYGEQRRLFPSSGLWAVDLLHEGGKTGGVVLSDAVHGVEAAMAAADPDYTWVVQAWAGNPRREFLESADREHLLILDLTGESWTKVGTFQGAPWVYGIVPNYGGRNCLYGDLRSLAQTPAAFAARPVERLCGLTDMAEGVENNAVVWDLFSDLTWCSEPIELEGWLDEWTRARYGADEPRLRSAWRVLLDTAYRDWRTEAMGSATRESVLALSGSLVDAATIDEVSVPRTWIPMAEDELEEALEKSRMEGVDFDIYASTDSVIAAIPSVHANQAGAVGPRRLSYDGKELVPALRHLVDGVPEQRTPGYEHDVVDVGRQVLEDLARRTLPLIASAVEAGDLDRFVVLSERFLKTIEIEDRLLASNKGFLLGSWVAAARAWGATEDESRALGRQATRLLTSWGYKDAFTLTEYANRSWAGLVGDYYGLRWRLWFDQLGLTLRGEPTTPVDWYQVAADWIDSDPELALEPVGDPVEIAREVLTFVTEADAAS